MKRRRYRRKPIQKKPEGKDQFLKPTVQTKLSMGKPGDKYEVEADKMADQVVNNKKNDGAVQKKEGEEEVQQKSLAAGITPLVQLKSAAEEENVQAKQNDIQKMEEEEPVQAKEEEEESVQAKEEEESVQAKEEEEAVQAQEEEPVKAKEEEESVQAKEEEEAVQAQEEEESVQAKCNDCEKEGVQKREEEEVQAKSNKNQNNGPSIEGKLRKGKGGQQMDKKTKTEMESSFGADFSNVKIHNDDQAAQMSQEIGAQAFTHGNDIYFNKGKYTPNSNEGKHLLAHELTHTIQQKGMVQKKGISKTQDSIQRTASKPPADLACPVGNSSPAGGGETLNFPVSGSNFTKDQKEGINNFVRNWHLSPEPVRIDGYASVDGPEANNWHLSCKRALSAKYHLMNPSDGSPGIPASFITMFAHGETSQFGSLVQNRRVSVNLPTKLPVRPQLGAPVVETKTKKHAPDGSPDTRLSVGVGEKVELTASAAGNWSASDASTGTARILAGANKFIWTAPNRAASVTITFVSGAYTVTKVFSVVEPNAITGTNKTEIQYAPGVQGTYMTLKFRYHPLTVSFSNVESKEVSHAATNITGYYASHGMPHWHNTGDNFIPIGDDNIFLGTDHAFQTGYPSPWSAGGFDWDIPNHFRVTTESGDGKRFTTVDQDFRMIDATGKTRIDKAGLSVERTP